jgi:hypothetical protein
VRPPPQPAGHLHKAAALDDGLQPGRSVGRCWVAAFTSQPQAVSLQTPSSSRRPQPWPCTWHRSPRPADSSWLAVGSWLRGSPVSATNSLSSWRRRGRLHRGWGGGLGTWRSCCGQAGRMQGGGAQSHLLRCWEGGHAGRLSSSLEAAM